MVRGKQIGTGPLKPRCAPCILGILHTYPLTGKGWKILSASIFKGTILSAPDRSVVSVLRFEKLQIKKMCVKEVYYQDDEINVNRFDEIAI